VHRHSCSEKMNKTKINHYPSISIVIATFNSTRTITQCLTSIRAQKYPKDKIEIIVADGGSTDDTVQIAKTFGAKVIAIASSKQNAEYNKSIGIKHAQNELLAMIDHDNILPHAQWLSRMVQPFIDHPEVIGVETLRYAYDPKGSLLDRYFALFGSGDPIVWYLGKTDRLSYMFDDYRLSGCVVQKHPYYLVRFTEENMPTIGANGFLVRRKQLMQYAHASPGQYLDMDVNVDLIRAGYDTYAFVDDGILHKTGYGSVWYYFRRRMLFMRQYHIKKGKTDAKRRFRMVSNTNMWRLCVAVMLSSTLVVPFVESVRGWLKVRDRAWFLHPLMALGFVFIYAWVIIEHHARSYAHFIVER